MSETTETAILAGGCFWGMQDLIRKRPGVISHPGRLHRRRRPQRDLPQPRHPRRGHRDRLRPRADLATATCSSSSSRSTTRRRRTARATTSGSSYRSAIFYTTTSRSGSPRTPSPTSTPPASGPARSSPRSPPAGPFWEAEPEHQDYLERYPNGYTCHFVAAQLEAPAAGTPDPAGGTTWVLFAATATARRPDHAHGTAPPAASGACPSTSTPWASPWRRCGRLLLLDEPEPPRPSAEVAARRGAHPGLARPRRPAGASSTEFRDGRGRRPAAPPAGARPAT